VVLDLEKNSASGIYLPQASQPEFGEVTLDYPSGSIFNSESKVAICPNGDCMIHTLDIIYDAYGGDYYLGDLLYGVHRNFIFLSFYENN